MSVPSVSYLEAMEAGRYQEAVHDDELKKAADQGDPLAEAFLRVARVHRDEVTGDTSAALSSAKAALTVLQRDIEEGWTRRALTQHVEQCVEYLQAGKPLPDLPSGI